MKVLLPCVVPNSSIIRKKYAPAENFVASMVRVPELIDIFFSKTNFPFISVTISDKGKSVNFLSFIFKKDEVGFGDTSKR